MALNESNDKISAYIVARAADEARRKEKKITRFGETSTAEEVAAALTSEIQGKIVLITGVTRQSLGAEAARVVALNHPSLLILAGRTVSKIEETISDIKKAAPDVPTRCLQLDLSSKAQIRNAAAELNSWKLKVDVLINNAAVMYGAYTPSEDAELESMFATNYLGPWLFTNLIMGSILAAGSEMNSKPRIINISSRGHRMSDIRYDDPGFEKGTKYDKWQAYGQTKTGNILFSVALAQKLGDRIASFSVHPGGIVTNLMQNLEKDDLIAFGLMDTRGNFINRNFTWKSVHEGAATHIVAAFDPDIAGQNGAYLVDCAVDMEGASPYALDKTAAEKLWTMSERLVGQKFHHQ